MTAAERIARPFPAGSWFSGTLSLPLACMDAKGTPTDRQNGVEYRFPDGSRLFLSFDGGWEVTAAEEV